MSLTFFFLGTISTFLHDHKILRAYEDTILSFNDTILFLWNLFMFNICAYYLYFVNYAIIVLYWLHYFSPIFFAGVIWSDVLLMDEVLPEAAISDFSLVVLIYDF
mgnify:CR=1 FL=1